MAGRDRVGRWPKLENEITAAIRRSDVVLVCISPQSVKRKGFLHKEINEALDVAEQQPERTIYVIPVRLDECELPSRLGDYHCIDLFHKAGLAKLIRALRERATSLDISVAAASAHEEDSLPSPLLDLNVRTLPPEHSIPDSLFSYTAAEALAVYDFVVQPALPDRLQRLSELANNLVWTWTPEIQTVFKRLQPALWAASGENPLLLLARLEPSILESAAHDPSFLKAYHIACARLDENVQRKGTQNALEVACFSMEYGLTNCLPLYSGDLGVSVGDFLKTASDTALNMIGIGLRFRSHWLQLNNPDGWQRELYRDISWENLPSFEVVMDDGRELLVPFPTTTGLGYAKVWRM